MHDDVMIPPWMWHYREEQAAADEFMSFGVASDIDPERRSFLLHIIVGTPEQIARAELAQALFGWLP